MKFFGHLVVVNVLRNGYFFINPERLSEIVNQTFKFVIFSFF